MKKVLILLLLPFYSFATNRYISLSGSDGNSGTIGSPWLSISKVNTSALANDSVFFNRGDVFIGTLLPTKNGVYYGAYGTGAKPIITGFTTYTSGWTKESDSIYSHPITSEAPTNMVTVGGVQYAMGRYPDAGYLRYTTATATTITDLSLTNTPSWAGAEAVIRKVDYTLDRTYIQSQNNGVITFSNLTGNTTPAANFGYFIQNSKTTLTKFGEWYHDYVGSKFYMYFGATNPNTQTVKVATLNNILSSNNVDNIFIENLDFQGSIANGLNFQFAQDNCTIQNNNIQFIGSWGIQFLTNSTNDLITNNTISFCNSMGILSNGLSTSILNNTVTDIGTVSGQALATSGTGQAYINIYINGGGSIVRNNTIRRAAFDGIYQNYNGASIVQNNLVDSTCLILNDGGGIYSPGVDASVRWVDGNIILNTIGNIDGTPRTSPSVAGIYNDEACSNLTASNNTISTGNIAIKNHRGSNNTYVDNTLYDAAYSFRLEDDQPGNNQRNLSIRRNIAFAKTSTQFCFSFYDPFANDVALAGIYDSNYYARPINDNLNFNIRQLSTGTISRDLPGWVLISNQDAHSKGTPKIIASVNELHFAYNASNSPITVNFTGFARMDAKGAVYRNSAVIPAWRSLITMDNGTITPPTANAGADQSITLPTTSITVTGSGTGGSGTISSYKWSNTSGPTTPIINNMNTATPTFSGMAVAGLYSFKFVVTNSFGDSAIDFMNVVVNPAPIIQPTANAGMDKTITLPTNTVTDTATATFGSGTLVSYQWVQTAGPATVTFGTPTALITTVNNLVTAGNYSIKFTVTNSQGNSASDNMNITVNPAIPPVNQPPVSVPGSNQTIQLPTNTASVNGSGSTDPDGTIVSYQWFITGPNTATNSTPNSVTTTFGNLIAGQYSARLKVTDNSGDTGSATLTINVLAAANVPPVARAGADQTIRLPLDSVTVDASASTDGDGTIVAYLWSQITGPSTASILTPSTVTTKIKGLVAGLYQFKVKVTDNSGDTSVDDLKITVNPAFINPSAMVAPIPYPVLTLPTNSVTLTGSGTAFGGATITTYLWEEVAGNPSTGTLSSTSTAITNATNLLQGIYTYKLTVTDSNGLTGTNTIFVTVNPQPGPNIPVLLKIKP